MKILVPLKGELHSEIVLPYVQELARAWKARVILLRVLDPLNPVGDPMVAALAGKVADTRDRAEEYLRRVAEGFEGTLTRWVCQLGSPSEVICHEAARSSCDLIVFAPHGHSGLERWVFGSVAEEVARHAPCPVMLVRGEAVVSFRHIVIPTDGSEESLEVCRRLGNFAPAQGRVTLLHCTPQDSADQVLLSRLWERLAAHPDWKLQIVENTPKQGIVDWALDSDCNLIAMATHGRGGLQRAWAGSVTESVARRAPCPVLVFPPAYLHQVNGER